MFAFSDAPYRLRRPGHGNHEVLKRDHEDVIRVAEADGAPRGRPLMGTFPLHLEWWKRDEVRAAVRSGVPVFQTVRG